MREFELSRELFLYPVLAYFCGWKRMSNREDPREIQPARDSDSGTGILNNTYTSSVHPNRFDFFISYADGDVAWAEWIVWVLRSAGYKVVYKFEHLRPGNNIIYETDKAI